MDANIRFAPTAPSFLRPRWSISALILILAFSLAYFVHRLRAVLLGTASYQKPVLFYNRGEATRGRQIIQGNERRRALGALQDSSTLATESQTEYQTSLVQDLTVLPS